MIGGSSTRGASGTCGSATGSGAGAVADMVSAAGLFPPTGPTAVLPKTHRTGARAGSCESAGAAWVVAEEAAGDGVTPDDAGGVEVWSDLVAGAAEEVSVFFAGAARTGSLPLA